MCQINIQIKMEVARRDNESLNLLLDWILDHHHFLLCSFFTTEELEDTISLISNKFSQKVMSIMIWKQMIGELTGTVNEMQMSAQAGMVEEEELVDDIEDDETEDIGMSSQISSSTIRPQLEDDKEEIPRKEIKKTFQDIPATFLDLIEKHHNAAIIRV